MEGQLAGNRYLRLLVDQDNLLLLIRGTWVVPR